MDSEDREDDSSDMDLRELLSSVAVDDTKRIEPPAGLWERIQAEVGPEPAKTSDHAPASVVPIHHRRRVITVIGALAVAASVAVAVPIALSSGDRVQVISAAALSNKGLASFEATPEGSAELLTSHGRTYLYVSVDHAPAEAGDYLELWLIDTQVKGMVSLGPYTGPHRYEVPAGVNVSRYPIVDVSLEPEDGLPTHSGVSVVRGTLPASKNTV